MSCGSDLLERTLQILEEAGARYCVIGGQAVNAYAEPVVSLDLDLGIMFIRFGATQRVDKC